ncbi:hypothetical protein BN59_02780 [Legionella massiliensis]|uniref:Uncharacterized protein n=1 Tax=Legionella massiliensis TaxID=1034943 RepID=A0A078KVM6_9GAMM|nr:hypothetical protein [Legionella massiliensis]CDZ78470.1 hypothetical protein BN59_02780 [Legionella massiliensis]CEE14208.1 hypothetical protein BN1094_02780 [Legionella massiliensis]
MAAKKEHFSLITGQYLAEGETIIAAYRTRSVIRVFKESHEGLRQLRRFYGNMLGEEFFKRNLPENERLKEKDRKYFIKLADRAEHKNKSKPRIVTLPSAEADAVFEFLINDEPRLFMKQWAMVAYKIEKEQKKISQPQDVDEDQGERARLIR